MKIRVANWFRCPAREIELPDKGLVVVRGLNGTGKSSFFVEAVSEALYGKTARGTKSSPPYEVETKLGELEVTRSHDGRAAKVTWSVGGVSQGVSEGATKATARIIETLGLDADAWHRTHVLSAEKVARFSAAKDSERKGLLESLVGLADFDGALKSVRDQKKTLSSQFRDAEAEMDKARAVHGAAQDSVAEAEAEMVEVTTDREALAAAVEHARHELAASTARVAEGEALTRLFGNTATASRTLAALRREKAARAKKAVAETACDACGREYDESVDLAALEAVHVKAKRKAAEADAARATDQTAYSEAESELRSRRNAEKAAQQRLVDKTRALDAARHAAEQQEGAARRWETAKTRSDEALMDVIEAGGEVASLTYELQVVKGAEDILGLRGARARVLGFALQTLEVGANHALAVMGTPGRLTFGGTSGMASGGTSDTISIKVDPWGGGDGHDGSSGGERKRTDVAILVGLAGLYSTPAALGVQMPMVFDDVFDTLDAPGEEEISRLLVDLSRDRTVIVITQSDDLAASLASNTAKSFVF